MQKQQKIYKKKEEKTGAKNWKNIDKMTIEEPKRRKKKYGNSIINKGWAGDKY